jgi:hypothetical protein
MDKCQAVFLTAGDIMLPAVYLYSVAQRRNFHTAVWWNIAIVLKLTANALVEVLLHFPILCKNLTYLIVKFTTAIFFDGVNAMLTTSVIMAKIRVNV